MGNNVDDHTMIFISPFRLMVKRWKLIVGSCVVAVFAAIIVNQTVTPLYSETFMIEVPYLVLVQNYTEDVSDSAQTAKQNSNNKLSIIAPGEIFFLIRDIDSIRNQGQIKKLSELMGLPEQDIVRLSGVRLKKIKNSEVLLEVTVDLDQPGNEKGLAAGIVNYLNRQDLVRKKISDQMEIRNRLRSEIQSAIRSLESMQQNTLARMNGREVLPSGLNPAETSVSIIKLKQQLFDLDARTNHLRNIELVAEPLGSNGPIRPHKLLNIILAALAGLFFGMFFAIVYDVPTPKETTPA